MALFDDLQTSPLKTRLTVPIFAMMLLLRAQKLSSVFKIQAPDLVKAICVRTHTSPTSLQKITIAIHLMSTRPCDDPEVFEDEWLVEFFGCLLPSSRTLKKDKNKSKEPKFESRCVNAYGWEDAWGDGRSE